MNISEVKSDKKCIFSFLFKRICRSKNKKIIAHVTLNGVIGKESKLNGGINIENVEPLLKKAFETKNVSAVAISINSPGGSPVQSDLIYQKIRFFSKKKNIPVYTFAQDLAASGGYWLLLSGDEIYAHNSSIIGSIGVIFSNFGFVELINKIGVTRRIYTEGKNKAILDPFLPEDPENIKIIKEVQADIYDDFKNFVKERRVGKLKESDEYLFNGSFWSGKKSQKLGLVDGVGNLTEIMEKKYGSDVKIVKIANKKGFLKSFFSEKLTIDSLLSNITEKIEFNKYGL